MRLTFCIILSILFFSSCKKSKSDPPPPAPILDTLSSGWTKIIVPGNPGFHDIFFVQNTGFALSTHHIYRSTDGGTNWSVVYTTTAYATASNIGMGNALNAIFVSANGKIRFTHNGGNTFDSVTVADNSLTDVFFVSPTVAYASGEKFWKTTNAGATWTKLYDFPQTSESAFKFIHFINDQTGWAIGPAGLFKTTNGGTTWQKQIVALGNAGLSVFFADANIGFAGGFQGQVAKSTDGGATWTVATNGRMNSYLDLHFLDAITGYYCFGRDVFKTSNTGTSWQRVAKVGGDLGGLIEIHFTDPTHGWACGPDGIILKYVQ